MACVASSVIPPYRHTRHPSAKTAPAFLHAHQARQRSYRRHHHHKVRRGSSFAKIVNHHCPFLVPRRPPPHLQHPHLRPCLVERPRHHPNGKRRPPHPRHPTTRRA